MESVESERLKKLLMFKKGLMPDYNVVLEEFESMIQWKAMKSKKMAVPKAGIDEHLDRV